MLAAPEDNSLPHARCHPYEAQLDALEAILCSDTIAQVLGFTPPHSIENLEKLLECYRKTLLEPIELPAIKRACTLTTQGHTDELIKQDQTFASTHPEWLLLMPASTRIGRDYLNRLRPLQDERAIQRFIKAVKQGRCPGHHLTVFGLTMNIFSIAQRRGLAEYAQFALQAVVSTAAGKLKINHQERVYLLSKSEKQLPKSIDRLVA